jgi:NitT/TauT family transport system substrate-binding protein
MIGKLIKMLAAASALLIGAPAAHAEQIVVSHYEAQFFGTPYAIAAAKGYFRDAGLKDVEITGSSGGGTSVRNLMASGAIYAEVALAAAVSAIREGYPVKIVSPGADGHNSYWVTRPDTKLDGPEDLKGKRLAYTNPKSVTEGLARAFLEATGLTEKEVKLVAIGGVGAGLTALEQNVVDVAILPEPTLSQRMSMNPPPYKAEPWLNDLVPNFTQTVGIAPVEVIEKNPEKIQAVIDGRRKGVAFLYENPAEAGKIMSAVNGLSADENTQAIAGLRKISNKWWNAEGFNFDGMNATMKVMQLASGGTGDEKIDWSSMIDDRFLAKHN